MNKVILLILIGLICVHAEEENVNVEADIPIESLESLEPIDLPRQKNTRVRPKNMDEMNAIVQRLPSDSESIRENIIDSQFSCKERSPGYYADIENECQIFHRCLDDQRSIFSFICPESTVFNQKALVCVWNETMDFDCADSEQYYEDSNRAFQGNQTAENQISENMKNSTEIGMSQTATESSAMEGNEVSKSGVEIDEVETFKKAEIQEQPQMKPIKRWEIREENELTTNEDQTNSEVSNAIDEYIPEESDDEEIVEVMLPQNDIEDPHKPEFDDIDMADVLLPSEKLIAEPIIVSADETPEQLLDSIKEEEEVKDDEVLEKRAKSHRRRFLFRADA